MWAKELNSKDDAERTSIKGRMELTTFSQTKVAMSIARMRIQFWLNILDNFKSLLFCFHTFGVRRSIDVLDSENKPGSGSGSRALRLTEDVYHLESMKTKKKAFEII